MKFEENELEIAIVTYNRSGFIKEWLEYCYPSVKERNIRLSIYDSSTDDETKNCIEDFNRNHVALIRYHQVPSSVEVGYKPMFPLLESDAKYIWVMGDSRYHDFSVLDEKVFPYLKSDIDYVSLCIKNNEENDGKVYENLEELLRECFVSITCIGLSIIRTEIFAPLKINRSLSKYCDQKYKNNYAFAWIGYFLEMYQRGGKKAVFTVVPILEILPDQKKQTWFKRFYGCWCEDLCNLLDAVPDSYGNVDLVLRETWKYMGLDSVNYCYQTRRQGDLNVETFKKYRNNGMLARVTRHSRRMETFATIPLEELEECLHKELKVESEEFYGHCESAIPRIRQMAGKREISVYGAGRGGKIVKDCLETNGIPVKCFYDRKAGYLNEWEGIPVRSLENLDRNQEFLVISMTGCTGFVISGLKEHGIQGDAIYYPAMDG